MQTQYTISPFYQVLRDDPTWESFGEAEVRPYARQATAVFINRVETFMDDDMPYNSRVAQELPILLENLIQARSLMIPQSQEVVVIP